MGGGGASWIESSSFLTEPIFFVFQCLRQLFRAVRRCTSAAEVISDFCAQFGRCPNRQRTSPGSKAFKFSLTRATPTTHPEWPWRHPNRAWRTTYPFAMLILSIPEITLAFRPVPNRPASLSTSSTVRFFYYVLANEIDCPL